ncbi:hypothetical protein GGR58DRAFT_525235 [Xylaria digitata]|nr:hypothetical protein GGR58DRAFT_525235 [Xylaria digitata]
MPPYATFSVESSPDMYISNKIYTTPTGSAYPHMLLALSIPLAFASPRFPGRSLFFSCVIITLAISTQINPHFTNNPGIAQPFCQLWLVWYSALEKLLLSTRGSRVAGKPVIGPESLFCRNGRAAREAEGMTGFSPAKIIWALGLTINFRGSGWNFFVKNVPTLTPTERSSRFRFLISHPDFGWRLTKTVIWGPLFYYFLSFQYNMLSLFAIATTLSEPEDWPPLFGSISEVRYSFQAFAGYVVDVLRIPRKTSLSSNTQILLTFMMSSFFQAQMNPIIPVPSNIEFTERTYGMFQFFMWQALVISFEDTVQRIRGTGKPEWGRVGVGGRIWRGFRKPLGWMWVILSFWISIRWAADLTLRFRFGDQLMVPRSVVAPWTGLVFQSLRNR